MHRQFHNLSESWRERVRSAASVLLIVVSFINYDIIYGLLCRSICARPPKFPPIYKYNTYNNVFIQSTLYSGDKIYIINARREHVVSADALIELGSINLQHPMRRGATDRRTDTNLPSSRAALGSHRSPIIYINISGEWIRFVFNDLRSRRSQRSRKSPKCSRSACWSRILRSSARVRSARTCSLTFN